MAPDASPATKSARLLLFSNRNRCVALRDKFWRVTIGLLLFSKLYAYIRTSLSMASTWFNMTYFLFIQSRTVTVRPCFNLPVLCSWDMTFHTKNHARSFFFGSSSDRQSAPGNNWLSQILSIKLGPSKTKAYPTKPSEFCLPFLPVVHYMPVAQEKVSVPPHGWTVLLLCCTVVPTTTVILYCTTLLYDCTI